MRLRFDVTDSEMSSFKKPVGLQFVSPYKAVFNAWPWKNCGTPLSHSTPFYVNVIDLSQSGIDSDMKQYNGSSWVCYAHGIRSLFKDTAMHSWNIQKQSHKLVRGVFSYIVGVKNFGLLYKLIINQHNTQQDGVKD